MPDHAKKTTAIGKKIKQATKSKQKAAQAGKTNAAAHAKNSRNGNLLQEMRADNQRTDHDNDTTDFVFGYHAVMDALAANRGNKLFLQENRKDGKITAMKELAAQKGVPVKWVPKSKLDQLTEQQVHQGMVLGVSPFEYLTLSELLDQLLQRKPDPFLVILDGIEDPHNLGSIIRSADASGTDGIILPKHRSVGLTGIAAKAATGAAEHVPIARVTNITQTIKTLKTKGFWVYGTDMTGADYQTWNVTGPLALVIGNEGHGMSSGVKKEMDGLLTIPMVGTVQSLNAGVAAALLMYEVMRKRH